MEEAYTYILLALSMVMLATLVGRAWLNGHLFESTLMLIVIGVFGLAIHLHAKSRL